MSRYHAVGEQPFDTVFGRGPVSPVDIDREAHESSKESPASGGPHEVEPG